MPKLYFRYGTMNSSKTANLLMVAHNYRSQGRSPILMKPSVDTRFGDQTINSRAVEGQKVDILLTPDIDSFSDLKIDNTSCVLVDEAQFLSELNVDALRELTKKVPVICYGLRTDYKSRLFSGSKRLMEIADTIEEIKTVCLCCCKKAIINCKFYTEEGARVIVKDGSSEPDLGAEEKYIPMCWACWNS